MTKENFAFDQCPCTIQLRGLRSSPISHYCNVHQMSFEAYFSSLRIKLLLDVPLLVAKTKHGFRFRFVLTN